MRHASRLLVAFLLLPLASCVGLAFNTEVAETPAGRLAMARFVEPGTTTEQAMITRWGYPTQKIREGAQIEYVYRDMRSPPPFLVPQWGDSANYVIVTFQYGLATGVRTSDGIDCRATFAPRPPGYTRLGNPGTHRLVGRCPLEAFWGGAPVPLDADGRPGVELDAYPGGKASK